MTETEVLEFYPLAQRIARRYKWDGDSVEDLTQECMLRLLRVLRRVKQGRAAPPRTTQAWVRGLFVRAIHDVHGMQRKGKYKLRSKAAMTMRSLDAHILGTDITFGDTIPSILGIREYLSKVYEEAFWLELERLLGREVRSVVEHLVDAPHLKPATHARRLGIDLEQWEEWMDNVRAFTAAFFEVPAAV